MSVRIKYADLHGQVWMFRRNYPEDVSLILGKKALKRSLKTSDPKVARSRAAKLSTVYDEQVATARASYPKLLGEPQSPPEAPGSAPEWGQASREVVAHLRATLGQSGGLDFEATSPRKSPTVMSLGRTYLRKRSAELRHGGFKSVRYSVQLFLSKYGGLPVTELRREHGREFLDLIAQHSKVIGKAEKSQGLGLDQLVAFSRGRNDPITARTQKRIWWQVKHFLDWVVYEEELEQNPFKSVRFDRRVTPAPYAVMTDAEVTALLDARDPDLHALLLFCLLTGMRSGEAVGLLRDDLVRKGNLGWFVRVRPNAVRELKTEASEREVPLHPVLEDLLPSLPTDGRLFP